jgi:hypothetical protein
MRSDSGGVQFFDLVEVDWRSDHGPVANAVANSGFTAGATGATCTAAQPVAERGGGGRPGRRAGNTGRAARAGWTTGIASGSCAPASEPRRAWGIMVPES